MTAKTYGEATMATNWEYGDNAPQDPEQAGWEVMEETDE
jgi:hypothetical protein